MPPIPEGEQLTIVYPQGIPSPQALDSENSSSVVPGPYGERERVRALLDPTIVKSQGEWMDETDRVMGSPEEAQVFLAEILDSWGFTDEEMLRIFHSNQPKAASKEAQLFLRTASCLIYAKSLGFEFKPSIPEWLRQSYAPFKRPPLALMGSVKGMGTLITHFYSYCLQVAAQKDH